MLKIRPPTVTPNRVLTFLVVLMSLTLFIGLLPAQADESPVPSCAVTPALLGGQGFTFKGQGFTFKGQGFTFKGQGFTFKGQGAEEQAVIDEVVNNPISIGKWTDDRLGFFLQRLGLNAESTAILVVDEFKDADSHGYEVEQVVKDSLKTLNDDIDARNVALASQVPPKPPLPHMNISIIEVPIDTDAVNYEGAKIAAAIQSQIDGNSATIHHFVINMSFGLIACSAPATPTTPAFDFHQAVQVVQANNDAQPLSVLPLLDCVIASSDNPHYGGSHDHTVALAVFGYQNLNDKLVKISIGGSNNLNIPYLPDLGQPDQFEPGQQHAVFAVPFIGSSVTWSVTGPDGQQHSATAYRTSTPCTVPMPLTFTPVTPVVDCVASTGESTYEAQFGYTNANIIGFRIPASFLNKFSPGSQNQGQITTFIPGEHHNVFRVSFSGASLTWNVGGVTAVATPSSPACVVQEGFGLGDYLTQNLGVTQDQLPAFWTNLANKADQDDGTGTIRALLRTYLHNSSLPGGVTVVPVASAGNLRPFLGAAPLAPASWAETIAVSASVGDTDTRWSFSQDGQVIAPGAGYPFAPNVFGAGTSFSAPAFSVLAAMCSTVPKALHFDGTNPPLTNASNPKVLNNAPIGTTDLGPLACSPNRAPTIDPIGPHTDVAGTTIAPFQAVGHDLDGNQLSYSISGQPAGISISSSDGTISGTIAANAANTYNVTVTVTDNGTPQGTASTSFVWTVTPPVSTAQVVRIDIKPLSPANRINLRSHGLIAVTIFGSATFDASKIDVRTVTLAGAPVVIFHYIPVAVLFDTNFDRYRDLVVTVKVEDLQLTPTSTSATLNGKLLNGQAFTGTDAVTIVPPHAPHDTDPYTGSTVRNHTVTLNWQPIDEEDQAPTCYQVVIAPSQTFNRPTQTATVIQISSYTAFQVPNGTYFWHVAVSDCFGNAISPWSESWSFTVNAR